MKRTARICFLFSLLIFFIGGCLGAKQPTREIEYYTLEYDPPVLEFREPLASVIRVDRFRATPFYDSNRIIYRKKPFERDAYYYRKWRANPGDLVTYFLTRDMQQSSFFKTVLTSNNNAPASYVIEGSVDEFLEKDVKNSWEAVLSVSISLLAVNEPDINKKVLFQKNYAATETCGQKNPNGLAEAMSMAMTRVSKMIIGDVYNAITRHRNPTSES
jgi:cholesterol transport system auxiliary component